MDSIHRDDLFGRLLAALLKPPSREPDASLVRYQPPAALLDVSSEGAALAVLDVAGASPEEVSRRAERFVAAVGGHALVVVVGGGDDYKRPLAAVGAAAQAARRLSVYLVDPAGRLERLVGPRSPVVERAASSMATTPPLGLAELAAVVERGQKEREEAVNFAAQLHGRRPWVTMALLGVCVLLYLADELILRGPGWGASARVLVQDGQVWRLLSSAFLHVNALHLLMNMMGLWSFGGFLEPVLGWRRYLVLYGLSALGGSVASALFGNHPMVGASGALWGLMLGGFALMRAGKTIFPARMAAQLRQRLVGVLVLNVALSFVGGIDKFAHFGGGLVGLALVASGLLVPKAVGAVGDEPFWIRAAAPLMALLMAASVVVALLKAQP